MSLSRARSLRRWRAGLALAALLLPLTLFGLFELQAENLDALAATGAPVDAHVTDTSQHGRITRYAYRVDGVRYTWSAARDEVPYAVGEVFRATYLPSSPSFNRPIAVAALAAREAAATRSLAWKVVLGLGLGLALLALLTHRELLRVRAGVASELANPAAYRRRVAWTGVGLAAITGLVSALHARQANEQGESLVPVLLALVFSLILMGGVFFFVARKGPHQARTRAATLMRWISPIAVAITVLQLLAAALGVY